MVMFDEKFDSNFLIIDEKNKDKVIHPDSEMGLLLGFTSENFSGYLWKEENYITCSILVSKFPGRGNVQQLFKRILELGYTVKVPTPSNRMQGILEHLNFKCTQTINPLVGSIEVWEKSPLLEADPYVDWINNMALDVPELAYGKCMEMCALMQESFPELTLKKGVVFSKVNADNPCDKYPKQYPHCWLVTKDALIIDPTKSQFSLLGDLCYKEITVEKSFSKCMGCGQYFDSFSAYCGECEYSSADGF